jgi:hypothetical protein
MTNTPATTWIRVGLFALPIFGVLTAWQPSAHSLMPPST